MIRDSLINGMSSNYIRQCPLEKSTLLLTKGYNQAHALDIAEQHSDAYSQDFRMLV